MALISCPECGNSISNSARKCPSCGYALKKTNYKKILIVFGVIILILGSIYAAYHFLIYIPQHIPEHAAELLEKGDYIGADHLYAQLPQTEENELLREQLYYESRIVAAAKAEQGNLLFPDSMVISEIVVFEDFVYDKPNSTETNKKYHYNEPSILLHYLAKSKGGSMVDGFVIVDWEEGVYKPGTTVSDLTPESSLPWYIDETDSMAQIEFWDEQIVKYSILDQLYTKNQIGVFDLNRCNDVLSSSFGRDVKLIPAGGMVITPTPYAVTETPKP